jgi:capsular polysaccharide transport system permease protein
MSNEDRIKGWRARRKDSSYAVGSGVDAWRLDPAALFEAKAEPAVLFKPLLARLQGEPHDSVAARRGPGARHRRPIPPRSCCPFSARATP